MAFDTRRAVQKLVGVGLDDSHADAIVEVIGDATSPLVTLDILRAELKDLRAEFYRALLIQAGIVLTGVAAIAAIATLLARFA
jgi:hypothetical protein